MAKKSRLQPLGTDADRWAFLMTTRVTKRGQVTGYTRNEVAFLATLVHQGFAVGHAVDQLLRLDAAREKLTRRSPTPQVATRRVTVPVRSPATHLAPDHVRVPAIDALARASNGLHSRTEPIAAEIERIVNPAIEAFARVGVKRRQLARFRSGHVLAAAFVLVGAAERGIRRVSALELELLVQINEDRDAKGPPSLEAVKHRKSRRDLWKKHMKRARKLVPLLKELMTKNKAK